MTFEPRPTSERRRPPRRRRLGPRLVRWTLGLAAAALVFAAGVAVGEALHDNPEPSGDRTYIRTLRPLPLEPAGTTVTVTVAGG